MSQHQLKACWSWVPGICAVLVTRVLRNVWYAIKSKLKLWSCVVWVGIPTHGPQKRENGIASWLFPFFIYNARCMMNKQRMLFGPSDLWNVSGASGRLHRLRLPCPGRLLCSCRSCALSDLLQYVVREETWFGVTNHQFQPYSSPFCSQVSWIWAARPSSKHQDGRWPQRPHCHGNQDPPHSLTKDLQCQKGPQELRSAGIRLARVHRWNTGPDFSDYRA